MNNNKDYDWRVADWTNPEDFSAEAEQDCVKIQEVPYSTECIIIHPETNVIQLKEIN